MGKRNVSFSSGQTNPDVRFDKSPEDAKNALIIRRYKLLMPKVATPSSRMAEKVVKKGGTSN